jgi:hypothetical protein
MKVTQKSGALSVHWRTKDSNLVCEFREKYGLTDVKKYYSKFDVAVVVAPS